MKNFVRVLVHVAGFLAVWASLIPDAQAVPSYTRRYGVECARCHSVWGGLTGAGNTFKLSGYRAINGVPLKPESEDIELAHGSLTIPTTLPLSFITGVGYDYRTEKREASDGTSNKSTGSTLALEDASIFLTSPLGSHLSAFVEFPMYETRAWEFTPTGPAEANAKGRASHIQFNSEQPGFEVAKFFWNNALGDSAPYDAVNLLFGITHLPLAYSPGKVRIPVNQDLVYERRALDLISPRPVNDMLGSKADGLFRLSEPQGIFEVFGAYVPGKEFTEVSKKETPWIEYHVGISNGNNAKTSSKADKDLYSRVTVRWYMQSFGFFAFHSSDTYDDDLRTGSSIAGNPIGIMSGAQHSNSRNTYGPDFTLSLGAFGIPVSLDNDILFSRESDPTGFGQSFSWKGGMHQLNWFQSKETIAYARYDWIQGSHYDDTTAVVNGVTGITRAEPHEMDVVLGVQHLLNPNMKLIGEFRHHRFEDQASTPSTATLTDNGFTLRFMVGL